MTELASHRCSLWLQQHGYVNMKTQSQFHYWKTIDSQSWIHVYCNTSRNIISFSLETQKELSIDEYEEWLKELPECIALRSFMEATKSTKLTDFDNT